MIWFTITSLTRAKWNTCFLRIHKPGGLQSMGSRRVRHDWVTSLSLFTFMHWRRKWQPTPVFLPVESQGRGAWWAAVYGVAQSRTRLKRLRSSSSSLGLESWFSQLLRALQSWWPSVTILCHSNHSLYLISNVSGLRVTFWFTERNYSQL